MSPVTLAMKSTAQEMATFTVAGKRIDYPVRLAEQYTRLRRGTGYYFTGEQIDSLFPQDMASLLMRTPGVRVTGNGSIEFARCRPVGNIHVWVDGVRWTRYSSGDRGLDLGAETALRDIVPSSIQLVEIYGGNARIPGEFLEDACAVILIWRK